MGEFQNEIHKLQKQLETAQETIAEKDEEIENMQQKVALVSNGNTQHRDVLWRNGNAKVSPILQSDSSLMDEAVLVAPQNDEEKDPENIDQNQNGRRKRQQSLGDDDMKV